MIDHYQIDILRRFNRRVLPEYPTALASWFPTEPEFHRICTVDVSRAQCSSSSFPVCSAKDLYSGHSPPAFNLFSVRHLGGKPKRLSRHPNNAPATCNPNYAFPHRGPASDQIQFPWFQSACFESRSARPVGEPFGDAFKALIDFIHDNRKQSLSGTNPDSVPAPSAMIQWRI